MAKRAQGSNGRPFRRSYRTFVAIGRWEAVPFWDAPPPVLRYGEAALGASVLIGAGALASRGVWPAEIRVFRWANELPDEAFRAVWAPMQYGTFGAVPALAVLALARRRAPLAVAVAAAGTTAWVLAKAVKPIVAAGATGRDPDGRSSARERGRGSRLPLRPLRRLGRIDHRHLAACRRRVAPRLHRARGFRARRADVRGSAPAAGRPRRIGARTRCRVARQPRRPSVIPQVSGPRGRGRVRP
jgi:hypothetical protein